MKVSKIFDTIESFGNNKLILWGIWFLYSVLIILFAFTHEPFSDEFHVWSMDYRMSIPELVAYMRVEGHFCFWHLLVWPLVNWCGMDYHALFVVSTLAMSLAIWLLLFRVEFSFWGKLFLIFSAPAIYYFPAISRCYALIPPILMAIVVAYQKSQSPYWYCFLLGLLAHTHAYMEGLVGILWCIFVYDNVILTWKVNKVECKKNLYASLITIGMVFLAFIQVIGGLFDGYKGKGVGCAAAGTAQNWLLTFYHKHCLLFTTAIREHISKFPELDLLFTLFIFVIIVLLVYVVLNEKNRAIRWRAIWIMVAGIGWQIIFSTNIYFMHLQLVYLPLMVILFILALYYDFIDVRKVACICFGIWLLNTPSKSEPIKDLFFAHGPEVQIKQTVEKLVPKDAIIISDVQSTEMLQQTVYQYYGWQDIDSTILCQFIESVPITVGAEFYLCTHTVFENVEGLSVEQITKMTEGIPAYPEYYRPVQVAYLYKMTYDEGFVK